MMTKVRIVYMYCNVLACRKVFGIDKCNERGISYWLHNHILEVSFCLKFNDMDANMKFNTMASSSK